MKKNFLTFGFTVGTERLENIRQWFERHSVFLLTLLLTGISVASFLYYHKNGLALAYNDARSHLDIGRRVVEGLNPGAAQLGSVWLPLPHLLMAFTIWNDFMWHSGLAGAIQSMFAFVGTGLVIYLFLREIGAGLFARYVGVGLFAANINTLYLQSTAMTEPVLMGTMTVAAYSLLLWFKHQDKTLYLVQAAFWTMLATLTRYDGWFLLALSTALIASYVFWKRGYRAAEGTAVLYMTLAGFGVVLWLLWNLLIFGDPLYFATGPYSAKAQQDQLEAAGVLPTKYNWLESLKVYTYALAYNCGAFTMVTGVLGALVFWTNRRTDAALRIASVALAAPFLFNILALYLGHSVVFIQGVSGGTWFNVRYGILALPFLAIFSGYLVEWSRNARYVVAGLLLFVTFFFIHGADAVTIDDARVGSSQKNVTEVSGWLREHAGPEKGFILISAASHDSIIFSSGLPMKRFIHEGAGSYYDSAIRYPDRWARYIVVRSYSDDDSTWRLLKDNPGFKERYKKVDSYPFADIYQLDDKYLDDLITEPILDPRIKKR